VTTLWLDVAAFARLRCLQKRRARMLLAEWESTPLSPRVRRVRVGRGPLSLQVRADDVAQLYALDVADVHQIAA